MIADRRKTDRQDKEAAAWFTLLNDTDIANEDLERFDRWIQRPGNRQAYRRMETISAQAIDLRDHPALRAAARDALSRGSQAKAASTRTDRRWPHIWRGAALAGVMAAFATVWFAVQPKTYETEVGGRTTAHLDDGSTVELNTDTKLRVRFSRGERRLELVRGQAFFDVAHDPARPFLVSAGSMEVRAIGTRFDVRHDGAAAAVALADGRISVRDEDAASSSWTLSPGQGLTLRPGGRASSPIAVDVGSLTSWRRNIVTFHGVALADATAEMNRYEQTKITLAPGAPLQAKISGVFKPGDTEDFVAAVSASFNLEAIRKPDGGMELRPRPGA